MYSHLMILSYYKKGMQIMASIDKVKVGETTYDVSPSSTGTLSGYTSNDNVTPPRME